jgi:hypothetical protein
VSEYDPGIVVMLEQIERTPDAFSRGSLVVACCRARMEMEVMSAEIEALRAAVRNAAAIDDCAAQDAWLQEHAAVIARALEAPDA